MELGLHLPLLDLGGGPPSLDRLRTLVRAARYAGLAAVAANDHLVFRTPWLDGPTALAAVLADAGELDVMTTVALPVVRGPAVLAKQLTALQLLAGGRVLAGVGPGSSAADHRAVGADFDDRWGAFERALASLRPLLDGCPVPTDAGLPAPGVVLEPVAARRIPLWIGSWGSPAGLRRVARSADGWLASAYNTTPSDFRAARLALDAQLEAAGRDPADVPEGLSTGFLYLADGGRDAERFLRDRLAPALARSADELRGRVFVGTAEAVGDLMAAYRAAGLRRLLLWPLVDEVDQLGAAVELLGSPRAHGHEQPGPVGS
jgi:alkanesulfonate monooxygenase SsuD/methylene tetrahydromethanopterin reductase-like flavin-dependent oxidoreductase (luciferase family)